MNDKRVRRLLVTGSRDWTDEVAIGRALDVAYLELWNWQPIVLVHGAAQGADVTAARIWSRWGLRVEAHPARWSEYGKRAGFVRNQEMVKLGADLCLAFILNGSKGATMCADLAEKAGIPTRRFEVTS